MRENVVAIAVMALFLVLVMSAFVAMITYCCL
jgi:hypothetical protein